MKTDKRSEIRDWLVIVGGIAGFLICVTGLIYLLLGSAAPNAWRWLAATGIVASVLDLFVGIALGRRDSRLMREGMKEGNTQMLDAATKVVDVRRNTPRAAEVRQQPNPGWPAIDTPPAQTIIVRPDYKGDERVL